jgi:hypothetical protein
VPETRVAAPFRIAWQVVVTALVVVVLHVVTTPSVYAFLLVPFMEHDAHGVGVKPSWVGHLAQYGDAAVLSAIAGSLLGNLKGMRASHVLAAGLLSAGLRAAIHFGDATLRGYPPDGLSEVLLGTGMSLLSFVPLMLFFGARAAKMRDLYLS